MLPAPAAFKWARDRCDPSDFPAGQNVVVQLDQPIGRFTTGELRCPPLVLEPLAPE
jgi:hypothetical protein